jgi:Zn-dependent peptidase ImmA (M78 family)
MNNRAVLKANEIIEKYKTNNPEAILKKLGIDVLDVPLAGRMKELYFRDHVVLKAGLEKPERRQLLAHALCHHLLHAGNHLANKQRPYSFQNFHEKQADVFAAYLLMPESELEKLIDDNLSIYDLAEKFEVMSYFAKFRIGLAKYYQPKKYQVMWR